MLIISHVFTIFFSNSIFYSITFQDGDKLPSDNVKIEKFTINIDDSVLIDLKERLNKSRITDSLDGVNFEYGFNSEILKKLVDYWNNQYDWRSVEKSLNQYNHFKTQIEGLSVHFVHIKPKEIASNKVVPLILVHGWPGSFVEFYKIIPLLLTPKNGVVFELIIPSIPGYGFSQIPNKPGFNAGHAARIFVKLMKRLGHDKFYYHGGDWGAVIGDYTAKLFPKR